MKLLEPITLGPLTLKNRVVMAPMTRARAHTAGCPGPLHELYYSQRATAGMIITEGINISEQAIGSPSTPGLYTEAQIEGWRGVTKAVHAAGGLIVAQLWHTGRVGHTSVRNGALPVAPSAIAIVGQKTFTATGPQDFETPHELSTTEVRAVVEDYRIAAQNAHKAGFDGVELHGAFGYLPNQFLVDEANKRTDEYGGSIANRTKFVIDTMKALVDVWGPSRVGIKISPVIPYNGMIDSDPLSLFTHLINGLNELPLAYVQLMEAMFPLDKLPTWPKNSLATFGPLVRSPLMINGGYDRDKAEAVLTANTAQLVSFGTPFIANPDLVHRFATGAVLAQPDRATMYGGQEKGFSDYPALAS